MIGLIGKYGYINREGKEVDIIKYEYESGFLEGLTTVKLNDKEFHIVAETNM